MLHPTLIFQIYVCWAPGTVTDSLSSPRCSFQIRKLEIDSVRVSDATIWNRHLQDYLWQNTWAANIWGEKYFLCYVLKKYVECFHLIPNTPSKETHQKQPHAASLSLSSALYIIIFRMPRSVMRWNHAAAGAEWFSACQLSCWMMGFPVPLYPLPICRATEAITVMYG